jgi:hypothetical protein
MMEDVSGIFIDLEDLENFMKKVKRLLGYDEKEFLL